MAIRLQLWLHRWRFHSIDNGHFSSARMLARFKEGYLVFYHNGIVSPLDNEFFPIPGDVE